MWVVEELTFLIIIKAVVIGESEIAGGIVKVRSIETREEVL